MSLRDDRLPRNRVPQGPFILMINGYSENVYGTTKMKQRQRVAWVFAAFLLLVGSFRPIGAQQEDLIDSVIHRMAQEEHGGVFDAGHLLKPGGIRELETLARQWEGRGRRLWIVTVPAEVSPNAAAERIYGGLSLGERDVLIVLAPRSVYAKTEALKGERETLIRLAEESRRAFSTYRAKGLAEYASRIERRIEERRRGQARDRFDLIAGFLFGVTAGLVVIAVVRKRRREARARAYEARLAEATDILGEAAVEYDLGVSREQSDRVAELGARLEAARSATRRDDTTELDALVRDARALLEELRRARAEQAGETS
jgi:hypothetical protein